MRINRVEVWSGVALLGVSAVLIGGWETLFGEATLPAPNGFSFDGPEDRLDMTAPVSTTGYSEGYNEEGEWERTTYTVEYTPEERELLTKMRMEIAELEEQMRNARTVEEQSQIWSKIEGKRQVIRDVIVGTFERDTATKETVPVPDWAKSLPKTTNAQ